MKQKSNLNGMDAYSGCKLGANRVHAPGAETNCIDANAPDATEVIEPKKSCVFYSSWHNAIGRLSPQEQLTAYKMILDYSLNFIEPEDDGTLAYTIFVMAKPSIEKAEERYTMAVENGKKGGRPSVIDKDKVLELSNQGMTPSKIAKELGYNRDSVKSIVYRNKGAKGSNLNDNVNENIDINDNDDINNSINKKVNKNINNNTIIQHDSSLITSSSNDKKTYDDFSETEYKQVCIKYDTGSTVKELADEYNTTNDVIWKIIKFSLKLN